MEETKYADLREEVQRLREEQQRLRDEQEQLRRERANGHGVPNSRQQQEAGHEQQSEEKRNEHQRGCDNSTDSTRIR